MWVTKYAPKSFSEILGNKEIVNRLYSISFTKKINHFILCGPPGVGKSLMVNMLTTQLLGSFVQEGLLYFSSSDERNIQNIREKIHQFVPKRINTTSSKIIIFEEAELLGEGVQQMMRRLMEKHAHHATFIFICSSLSGMIETLQSRCQIFQLFPIPIDEQVKKMEEIAKIEKIEYSKSALETIAKLSHGDMRSCLNYFQTCFASSENITNDIVCNICLFPHYSILKKIFDLLLENVDKREKDNNKNRLYDIIKNVRKLYIQGYGGLDIIIFFNNYLKMIDIERRLYLELCKEISISHIRLSQGGDSFAQVCGLITRMYNNIDKMSESSKSIMPEHL